MSLKFRCQARHPLSEKYSQIYTLNTVDGKEAGKEDFTTKMIAPRGVNKTDKTPQGSPEFAHESPFFINFFFFTFPCRGGSLHGFNCSQTFDKVSDLE